MTAVVITPELERSLVVKRGIVTVPDEMATQSCDCLNRIPCRGIDVNSLPLVARELQRQLLEMGEKFIERMAVRGLINQGGLFLHGSWISYEFNEKLVDMEAEAWKQAQLLDDPSLVLPFVMERKENSYRDYLLVGHFIEKNRWIEVVEEEPDAD